MRLNVFMIILKLAKSQTKLEQSNEACLALNESDFVQLPYIRDLVVSFDKRVF